MAHQVKIKKTDDVCLNCISFVPSELKDSRDGTPLGECRRRCPQLLWHFIANDAATIFPIVAVNSKCMDGLRPNGETYLARTIERNKKGSKR